MQQGLPVHDGGQHGGDYRAKALGKIEQSQVQWDVLLLELLAG